jgi:hypothetical protein
MKIARIKTLVSGLTLSVAIIASSAASALAAPSPQAPPSRNQVSGPQAKAPIEPGSKDAKVSDKLGNTNLLKLDGAGKPDTSNNVSALAGTVSNVDFQTPYNYCWRNLVYTPVRNTTGSTQYLHILLYNQGHYRDLYTSVAANSTAYPAFYGVDGAYTAYLYVWNGSNYQYDEYLSSNNTCNVSVSRVYNTGGWVELKIQNLGTAYATQISTELAPYPGSGTYTGTQYDYPVAGGAAIYRWFYVGTQPYGINSYTYGSFNMPYQFTGDL